MYTQDKKTNLFQAYQCSIQSARIHYCFYLYNWSSFIFIAFRSSSCLQFCGPSSCPRFQVFCQMSAKSSPILHKSDVCYLFSSTTHLSVDLSTSAVMISVCFYNCLCEKPHPLSINTDCSVNQASLVYKYFLKTTELEVLLMTANDIKQGSKHTDLLHAMFHGQPCIINLLQARKQNHCTHVSKQWSNWRFLMLTFSKEPLGNLFIEVTLWTVCDHFPTSRDLSSLFILHYPFMVPLHHDQHYLLELGMPISYSNQHSEY